VARCPWDCHPDRQTTMHYKLEMVPMSSKKST
jgi:hypothetical protein